MIRLAVALIMTGLLGQTGWAAQIRGQYMEARSCDVYTGPCFANAEMQLAGKEAVMAWKVDEGTWNGETLTGLSVAVVLKSSKTLGYDGVFAQEIGPIRSVILVDDQASPAQQNALVSFVRESASQYLSDVQSIQPVKMSLSHDMETGDGIFKAGRLAEVRTRGLEDFDCICTNEKIFYQPLADVQNYIPAYSLAQSFRGAGLDSRWTIQNTRSSFLATFRY